MNAGSYGREFKDIVASVEVLDTEGNLIIVPVDRIGFSYRTNSLPKDLIFTRVFFQAKNKEDTNKIKQKMDEISAIRSSSQPVSEKTGGSTFANPEGFKAWELIDKAGLRGVRVGGACMSEMHCNFMINANNATATDMENLGELVKQKVKENSGIELQWEIKRIGKL
jgi:UDP-N-acetylmuramate dehydrogenase